MKTIVAVIIAFPMLLTSCQHKSQNTSLDESVVSLTLSGLATQ